MCQSMKFMEANRNPAFHKDTVRISPACLMTRKSIWQILYLRTDTRVFCLYVWQSARLTKLYFAEISGIGIFTRLIIHFQFTEPDCLYSIVFSYTMKRPLQPVKSHFVNSFSPYSFEPLERFIFWVSMWQQVPVSASIQCNRVHFCEHRVQKIVKNLPEKEE